LNVILQFPEYWLKTENGSRGGQPYREVQIARRCLAPLPLRDSSNLPTITEFILRIK